MNAEYRLSWEMVNLSELGRYCNANPNFYAHTTQTIPNSEIPDQHWHPVAKVTTDPWSQYNQLKAWADADKEFVRNVKLERAAQAEREWIDIGGERP